MALPDITVQQLEYLDAVADHATWAEAATSLGVSPSALSQGLAELERRIGVALFSRDGRRRVPTVDHAPVLDHARRVLGQTRDLVQWADGRRAGRTGQLRVGMIDSAAVDRFPDVLRRYRTERPEVAFLLTVAPSEALLGRLARAELDLVVCVEPGEPVPFVHTEPIAEEPLFLYAPDGRRTSRPGSWGPWVTFPEGSHTRTVIAAAVRAEGAPFDVVADSHQPEVLREMVHLGLGWTALPAAQAEAGPRPLVPARRAALVTRRLVLARREGALGPVPADDLADRLRRSG